MATVLGLSVALIGLALTLYAAVANPAALPIVWPLPFAGLLVAALDLQ